MACLFEVDFDSGIRIGTVFHCIAKGKAGGGGIVSCFDGCKPGGWDWGSGGGVVELDKSADAGEVVCVGGLRGCRGGGKCGGWGEHKGKWCLG